jgi:hypothetical protein
MKSRTKVNVSLLIIKVVLCVALMVASTYSLFTAEDGASICVTAGELKVDLLQATSTGEYVSIRDQNGNVFGNREWEPNHTRIVFLRVANQSEMPIKYLLEMNVALNDLAGAFEYSVLEKTVYDTTGESWEDFNADTEPVLMIDGINPVSDQNYLELAPRSQKDFALAVHMKADSGNQYQGKRDTLEAGSIYIHLFAVQGNADTTQIDDTVKYN